MDANQIAAVARSAGLSDPGNVAIATAIALAESGGNPQSHNPRPPDNSYGLWQINMLGSMGPARRKQFGISSNDQLFDPATNARAMMAISNGGTNFRPWTTFTSGSYLRFMGQAQAAAGNTTTGGTTAQQAGLFDIPGNVADGVKGLVSGIGAIQAWVTDRHNWIRVGWVGLGVGFIIVAAGSVAGKPTAEIVGKVGGIAAKGAVL